MADDNWEIIKRNAETAFQENTIFKSFRKNRSYKILAVKEKIIIIERVSGGKNAGLSKGKILKSIETLKEHDRIKKGKLIHTVVLETMLVYLHPNICWDSEANEVYWDKKDEIQISLDSTEKFIEQASDDELEKILVQINRRKNQNKFRHVLLKLYKNKCAISSTGPDAVLQAAHISPHAKNGINKNENGILLRSDLHDLFDNDLLLIHPKKLSIHLHPSLKSTYYSIYEGKRLASRIDKSKPDYEYLLEKWNSSSWSETLE
ncbi:MAG: HNH endonuclease signature motif containing protein [Chitinophagales bacterium]